MHKKKHPFIILLNILIFLLVLLFYYTGILPLSIKGITPLLILPLLTAFAIYHSPITSALIGLACGIFMDACAIGAYCFNAIVLLLIATFVAVTSNNLFNKNIQSAVVLSLITSAFYFVLQWICFHTDNVNLNDTFIYLLKYAFPSAFFSAVFILPFYYLYRYFHKITSE
jgi:cell shape-determining protein MreD